MKRVGIRRGARIEKFILLRVFYALYATFAVLSISASIRNLRDAVFIPLILFAVFILYLKDRGSVKRRLL